MTSVYYFHIILTSGHSWSFVVTRGHSWSFVVTRVYSIQFNSNLYFDTVKNSPGFGTIYNYITIINNNKYVSKSLTYNYIKQHLFSMNAVSLI